MVVYKPNRTKKVRAARATRRNRTSEYRSSGRSSGRSSTKKKALRSISVKKRKRTPSPRSTKRSKIYRASTYNSPSVPTLPLFQTRIPNSFFSTPSKYPKDCCPCVFKLLGLVGNDEVNEMIDEFGEKGMDVDDIEGKFAVSWPGRSFKFINNDSKKMSMHQFINSVFKSLEPLHAALMGWRDSAGDGHCIVFMKNRDGVARFFDAQSMDLVDGLAAVHDVFRDKQEVYALTVDKGGLVVG